MFLRAKKIIIFLVVIVLGGVIYFLPNIRGAWFALKNPPEDIAQKLEGENKTDFPLKLPPSFSISIFAKNLPGARDMAIDQFGNMWVSRTQKGVVTQLVVANGVVKEQHDVFQNLSVPHGLATDPKYPTALYIATENAILRAHLYSDGLIEKVIDLPSGGNHNYHSLRFGPDDRIYVKMGSTCNVCHERDERRATIYSLKRDGSDFKLFARGLRNAPFMTFNPVDGKMWVTEMGRDLLGDDTPPDEINIVEEGKNYGWPNCYGKNIHDTDFDTEKSLPAGRQACMEPFETPSYIDIPAHSAPLGLVFVPKDSSWPKEYWGDLIVAYHGSWNRTVPTGYKVVRMKLDEKGNYEDTEDFITGWLTPEGPLGRPVGILIQPDGTMYISDDKAGVIYKVTYNSSL